MSRGLGDVYKRQEHGYGLKNVKKVLDKYISTLDFECSDERFTVEILMKI